MIKVIETNLMLNSINNIEDHQSRVIEVESWESYVAEIKEGKSVYRKSIFGCLDGCSLPEKAQVENLMYDEYHLDCTVIDRHGFISKKLAYKDLL
jgi:hypothetical protein